MSLGRFRKISEGRPQDVGRTPPLQFHSRPYRDILKTYAGDVLKTLVRDVPRRYI